MRGSFNLDEERIYRFTKQLTFCCWFLFLLLRLFSDYRLLSNFYVFCLTNLRCFWKNFRWELGTPLCFPWVHDRTHINALRMICFRCLWAQNFLCYCFCQNRNFGWDCFFSWFNEIKLALLIVLTKVVSVRESSFISLIALLLFTSHALIRMFWFLNNIEWLFGDFLTSFFKNNFFLLGLLIWMWRTCLAIVRACLLSSSLPQCLHVRTASSLYKLNIFFIFVSSVDQSFSLICIIDQRKVRCINSDFWTLLLYYFVPAFFSRGRLEKLN